MKKPSIKVSDRKSEEPEETPPTQSQPCTAIAEHTPAQYKQAKESGGDAEPLLPSDSVKVSKRKAEDSDEEAAAAGYTQSGPLTAIADHTPAQQRQEEELKEDEEGPEPLLPLGD